MKYLPLNHAVELTKPKTDDAINVDKIKERNKLPEGQQWYQQDGEVV